jgi:hypothetical protein
LTLKSVAKFLLLTLLALTGVVLCTPLALLSASYQQLYQHATDSWMTKRCDPEYKMAPQSHPRAQFVPIPPNLDLCALVENRSNFDYVTRLPNEMLKEHSIQSLEQLVLLHVVIGGRPLVIEGWGERLDPYLFSSEWLQKNLGQKRE